MSVNPGIVGKDFWAMPEADVVDVLESDVRDGITEDEARRRLQMYGANSIEQHGRSAAYFIFVDQFKSPLILVLAIAGVITLSIGHLRDSLFILAALAVNVGLGFYQEHKASRALAGLKSYLRERARVIRGGVEREVDAAHLVPGDLLRLSQGDRVPADARLVYVNDLQIDEALLTGESLPAEKSAQPSGKDAVLGDQECMVFAGTLVTEGLGTALVCRTNSATELGKIAALVGRTDNEDTPLQATIKKFSARAGLLLGGLTVFVFVLGIYSGHSFADMFITSVAVAVAAVPEGLPIALTVILAIGVQRMAGRKGVIRKLVAAEALGSTTFILTDKTGTLTMAKMELGKLLPEGLEKNTLLELAVLNSNVLVENRQDPVAEWRMSGKILEVSLIRAAALRDISDVEVKQQYKIVRSLPFNAVNKFSASLIERAGKHELIFFGAADILVERSLMNDSEKRHALQRIHTLAAGGEFVVAVATKTVDAKEAGAFPKDVKAERLAFKGLLTLRDPIRPGVEDAIRRVERAGVRTVIMTGDHRGTAEAIAREVGLPVGEGSVLDAAELRGLSPQELKHRLATLRVISRVSPLDKMMIVKTLQEMGEVVAMTGDGVNDAPSIRQADIGIAMGSGTEVARDVADLVLLDDNFETIVAAVEEGRQILKNIRKVLVYLLYSVFAELLLIGGALVVGLPLPLNALQILYVNFFSDSFPAVAFAFEKGDGTLEGRPSTHLGRSDGSLFDPLMRFLVLFVGFSTSAFLFGLYWLLLHLGFPTALVQTFIFASFGSYTLFLAFSLRDLDKSIFRYNFFSNSYLIGGVSIGIALLLLAIYVPLLQGVLGTVALPPVWLLCVVLIGVLNMTAIELGKALFRKRA
ncbi:HAD-IC family P-type ATPase [Candidatus Kaiserbacteria bacterium]|nr:HAD-IC family P-type ATPase [Candidatus Kaiserbacteria bacterium]